MKIVEPKYEILTDISEGGIKELQQIERVARVCYKSEDKITPDGESAKKLGGAASHCFFCTGEHPVLQLLEGEVWRRANVYLAFLYSWRAVL